MYNALRVIWVLAKKHSFRFVDNQKNQFTTYQLHRKESETVEFFFAGEKEIKAVLD